MRAKIYRQPLFNTKPFDRTDWCHPKKLYCELTPKLIYCTVRRILITLINKSYSLLSLKTMRIYQNQNVENALRSTKYKTLNLLYAHSLGKFQSTFYRNQPSITIR